MEEQGRVRRGHFVDGLEGAQFAWAGAVDRLRGSREQAEERDELTTLDDVRILSAMDPANPYGAIVPWPAVANPEQAKPRRVAGAWLITARGRPVLYVARRARILITFPATIRDDDSTLDAAIEALRHLPRGSSRGMLVIETVDGQPIAESPFAERFTRAGFAKDYRGVVDVRSLDDSRSHPAGG